VGSIRPPGLSLWNSLSRIKRASSYAAALHLAIAHTAFLNGSRFPPGGLRTSSCSVGSFWGSPAEPKVTALIQTIQREAARQMAPATGLSSHELDRISTRLVCRRCCDWPERWRELLLPCRQGASDRLRCISPPANRPYAVREDQSGGDHFSSSGVIRPNGRMRALPVSSRLRRRYTTRMSNSNRLEVSESWMGPASHQTRRRPRP
jgi:hypothetical protein